MSSNTLPVLNNEPLSPARPGFANPLKQMSGLFAQPAVRRSLPMIALVGLLAAAALAWTMLSTPPQRVLFSNLAESDKGAISEALAQASIPSNLDSGSGALTVAEDDYHKARMLLASQNLPKSTPGGYAILDDLPMGVSRAVEGERLRQARETELARSIEEIESVGEARVHLAMPENTVFIRDNAAPSASVILKLNAGRSLDEAQTRSIVNLVASSVPGMKPDAVTIVDQMGALLTKPAGEAGSSVGDQRIDFQRRVEDKYRAQLLQLLTPLLGAGNFSTEVQADVNLDETQATRESYDKQGVLRTEQGSWTGNQSGTQPGGIPGALSNTAPPASTLVAGAAAPGTPGAVPPAGAAPGAAMPDAMKSSDTFARQYDLGREVSVTRAVPGDVRRLSVAVVLREEAGAKPRTRAEIDQLTQLVRAAVGYDVKRQDQVTVISRNFAGAAELNDQPWYDAAWLPMVARNLTAVVIALLVLFMGVKPLVKAITGRKKEEEAAKAALPMGNATAAEDAVVVPPPPASLDRLDGARSYDDKIGIVRDFTRDNPTRAALAVRDMIRGDAVVEGAR